MAIVRIRGSFAQNSYFTESDANAFTRASREMLATFASDRPVVFAGSGKLKPEHLADGTHDLLSIYRGVGWYKHLGAGVYASISNTNLGVVRLGTGRFEVTSGDSFETDNWGLDVHAHSFQPGWPGTTVNATFAAEVEPDPADPTPAYAAYTPSATVRHFQVLGSAWGSGVNTLALVDPDLFFVGTIGVLL